MTLFEKLEKGLQEAIEYQKGNTTVAKRIHHKEDVKFKPIQQMKPNDIKSLRLSLGLSQKEFSDALGVSYETVAKWEQGGNKPQGIALRFMQLIKEHKNILEDISVGKTYYAR
ncbi:MAG: helix-turn-helix domain-containing protein [Bdellovibrionota bacterium]